MVSGFQISVTDLKWLSFADHEESYVNDNPEDLCLHGHATAIIGDESFEYDAAVSSTALYLLKSLTEDHVINEDNQLLPCCGFTMWLKDDGSGDVFVMGCDDGIDWSILHEKDTVRLITKSGKETVVSLEEYKEQVFSFADFIEEFYQNCQEKVLPEDEHDRRGYLAFWEEWHRRRQA